VFSFDNEPCNFISFLQLGAQKVNPEAPSGTHGRVQLGAQKVNPEAPSGTDGRAPPAMNVTAFSLRQIVSSDVYASEGMASISVIGMAFLALALVVVTAVCLYAPDLDEDVSLRTGRSVGGSRSGGERPVPNHGQPTRGVGTVAAHPGSPASVLSKGPKQALIPEESSQSHQYMTTPFQQRFAPQAPLQYSPMVQQRPGPSPSHSATPFWEALSHASSSGARSLGMGLTRGVPALCPSLVLPHCEAWFAMSWDKVGLTTGSFDLFGLSGQALFHTRVTTDGAGRCRVALSMTPARSPTLGSCSGRRGGVIEIHGASGDVYGELRRRSAPGSYALLHHASGQEVLTMNFETPPANHLSMVAMDGSIVAAAAHCVESELYPGLGHLEVRVNRGGDAVLILSCLFGLLIIDGGDMPNGLPLASVSPLSETES